MFLCEFQNMCCVSFLLQTDKLLGRSVYMYFCVLLSSNKIVQKLFLTIATVFIFQFYYAGVFSILQKNHIFLAYNLEKLQIQMFLEVVCFWYTRSWNLNKSCFKKLIWYATAFYWVECVFQWKNWQEALNKVKWEQRVFLLLVLKFKQLKKLLNKWKTIAMSYFFMIIW